MQLTCVGRVCVELVFLLRADALRDGEWAWYALGAMVVVVPSIGV